MKQFKLILLVIVLAFVAIVIYQNWNFFAHRELLGINLYFWQYDSRKLSNGILFLALFIIGFLLAYFSSLSVRYKAGKTIKNLNSTNASQQEMIDALKSKLEALQQPAEPDSEVPAQAEESVDQEQNSDKV